MRAYVDSSALLKRVVEETESAALVAELRDFMTSGAAVVTSSLAWVEVSRALRTRAFTDPRIETEELVQIALSGVLERPMGAEVLALARRMDPPVLRSLDAIHLATAVLIDADVVLAYDRRLADAGVRLGLRMTSPGSN